MYIFNNIPQNYFAIGGAILAAIWVYLQFFKKKQVTDGDNGPTTVDRGSAGIHKSTTAKAISDANIEKL